MSEKNTNKEVNHGLSIEVCESLMSVGFEPDTMMFYNTREATPDNPSRNFLDSIDCMKKLLKKHMGGNYGRSDEYIIVKSDGVFRFQYWGDCSARITKISELKIKNINKYF